MNIGKVMLNKLRAIERNISELKVEKQTLLNKYVSMDKEVLIKEIEEEI